MIRKRLIYVCALVITVVVAGYALKQASTGAQKTMDATVLAVVNGRKITRSEVDERAGSQLQSAENKLYQIRKTALNGIIGDALLEEEATKKGISVEELKKTLVPAQVQISDSQVEIAYSMQAKRFEKVEGNAARQQVRAAMENRARLGSYDKFIGELKERGQVDIFLQPPAPYKVNVSSTGPSKGSPNARAVLIEFSDFECPACKKNEAMVKRLLAQYGDKVKFVYKHLPLSMHKDAFGAARAAVCAEQQGKFWEMHALLFEKAQGLTSEAFRGYAAQLGLKADAFDTCLESEASRAAVTRDLEEARAAGIASTPTFILNGKLLSGIKSIEEFKALIDAELQSGSSGQ